MVMAAMVYVLDSPCVHHTPLNNIILIPGPERRTKYGCEGSSLELECEEGTVISLVRANYGRFSISICNGEGNTAWSVNCMEPRTLRVINTRWEDYQDYSDSKNISLCNKLRAFQVANLFILYRQLALLLWHRVLLLRV